MSETRNQILKLKEGETKKNPGVATVLSCFYCGLGQLYNGQILKGILYMFFYGIFIGLAITVFSVGNYAALLSLVTLSIILWITGMINANEVARKINVQLDSLIFLKVNDREIRLRLLVTQKYVAIYQLSQFLLIAV